MEVVFKRAIWVDNKLYPAGRQDVDDALLGTKNFVNHINAGNIVDAATVRKTVAKTVEQNAKTFLEKVLGKKVSNATPEQAAKLSGGVKSESAVKPGAPATPKASPDPKAPIQGAPQAQKK